MQILTLFLTLDISTSQRLAQHNEWKQAMLEEPLFRSFQFARTLPPPTRSNAPQPVSPPPPNGSTAADAIMGVGKSLYKGVYAFGRKVHSTMSASTAVVESTGDPDMDSAQSQKAYSADRVRKCAPALLVNAWSSRRQLPCAPHARLARRQRTWCTALCTRFDSCTYANCRYEELLRLWHNVNAGADSLGTSLTCMRDAFDQLCAQEDPSSRGPTYTTPERAKQVSTDHRKVAYTSGWVARSLAAYVTVAEDAGLPWKHVESGWRAALAAGEERIVLWGAKVQLQRQVQRKRESYHILSPAVRSSRPRCLRLASACAQLVIPVVC